MVHVLCLIMFDSITENRLASRDKSHHRTGCEGFDVYLRNQVNSLPTKLKLQGSKLDEFITLYRHARHEPKVSLIIYP